MRNLVYFHTHSRLLASKQAVTGKTREEITLEVQDMSWGTFKPLLADATVEHLVSLCSHFSFNPCVFRCTHRDGVRRELQCCCSKMSSYSSAVFFLPSFRSILDIGVHYFRNRSVLRPPRHEVFSDPNFLDLLQYV